MSNVREFWLTNRSGKKYSLHRLETFANKPEGLGFRVDISTVRLGNSNMIVSDEYNLGSFTADLLFIMERDKAYQQYFEFIQFLYDKPIQLHYRTPNTFDSYFCQVRIVEVEKSEVNYKDSMLHIPITMYRQTLWYTDKVNQIVVEKQVEEGKQYILNRPYHYGATNTDNISITNAGVNDTPLLVEVNGEAYNPTWTLYDSNGIAYGRARILGTYDYVSVDSDDLNENISVMRDNAWLPNAINFQDLSVGDPRKIYVTFLKLKPGTSKLVFTLDDGFTGNVKISWRNAYVTV